MEVLARRVRDALPGINLVTIVVMVALLWWRMAALEAQVSQLSEEVVSLRIAVARLTR